MLSKLDGRAWRWLSPAAADGFEPVFSRSWGPNAPSRPGRAAGSCPRWESSKANLIWTRVCSHQYHQLVQAEHSVYPVKYRDTWYLCPLGNPDIATNEPALVVGVAEILFSGRYGLTRLEMRVYDVSPDGQRFLMLKETRDSDDDAARDEIHVGTQLVEAIAIAGFRGLGVTSRRLDKPVKNGRFRLTAATPLHVS